MILKNPRVVKDFWTFPGDFSAEPAMFDKEPAA